MVGTQDWEHRKSVGRRRYMGCWVCRSKKSVRDKAKREKIRLNSLKLLALNTWLNLLLLPLRLLCLEYTSVSFKIELRWSKEYTLLHYGKQEKIFLFRTPSSSTFRLACLSFYCVVDSRNFFSSSSLHSFIYVTECQVVPHGLRLNPLDEFGWSTTSASAREVKLLSGVKFN